MLLAKDASVAAVGASRLDVGGGEVDAGGHVGELGQVVIAEVAEAAVPQLGCVDAGCVGGGHGVGGRAGLEAAAGQVVDATCGVGVAGGNHLVVLGDLAVGVVEAEAEASLGGLADGQQVVGGAGDVEHIGELDQGAGVGLQVGVADERGLTDAAVAKGDDDGVWRRAQVGEQLLVWCDVPGGASVQDPVVVDGVGGGGGGEGDGAVLLAGVAVVRWRALHAVAGAAGLHVSALLLALGSIVSRLVAVEAGVLGVCTRITG